MASWFLRGGANQSSTLGHHLIALLLRGELGGSDTEATLLKEAIWHVESEGYIPAMPRNLVSEVVTGGPSLLAWL